MNCSWHLRHKALRELIASEYGSRRMRLHVLIIFSFIALLLLGPMAFESEQDAPPISARAEKAQREFAAGSLSDRDLLIILVCVAALILIIVAVR